MTGAQAQRARVRHVVAVGAIAALVGAAACSTDGGSTAERPVAIVTSTKVAARPGTTTGPIAASVTPSATESSPALDLATFDPSSATLPPRTCGAGGAPAGPVVLIDGAWNGRSDGSDGEATIRLVRTVRGDINGDGATDVVSLFQVEPGGTMQFGCLVGWSSPAAAVVATDAAWPASGSGVLRGESELAIEGGQVNTTLHDWSASDPHCCPSITTRTAVRWSPSGFEVVAVSQSKSLDGPVISTAGAGPVELGMTVDEAVAASGLEPRESCGIQLGDQSGLSVDVGADGRIVTIRSSNPSRTTMSGGAVGMTRQDFARLFGSRAVDGEFYGSPLTIVRSDDGSAQVVFHFLGKDTVQYIAVGRGKAAEREDC